MILLPGYVALKCYIKNPLLYDIKCWVQMLPRPKYSIFSKCVVIITLVGSCGVRGQSQHNQLAVFHFAWCHSFPSFPTHSLKSNGHFANVLPASSLTIPPLPTFKTHTHMHISGHSHFREHYIDLHSFSENLILTITLTINTTCLTLTLTLTTDLEISHFPTENTTLSPIAQAVPNELVQTEIRPQK